MKPILALVLLTLLLSACAPFYMIPTDPADFAALGLRPPESPQDIEAALNLEPAATLPATLATIRLQGRGGPCVVTVRTIEDDAGMDRLASLPQVQSLVPLSGLILPGHIESLGSVRAAAANVRADLVLVYTFETTSKSDTTIPLLGTLTLGLFPNEIARATSTGSAALVDTRTGYIYGLTEATAKEYRITNAWNINTAMHNSEQGAQTKACKDLITQVERMWDYVLERNALSAR